MNFRQVRSAFIFSLTLLHFWGCDPAETPGDRNDGLTEADPLLTGTQPVLIFNALIVDGSGSEPFRGSILLESGRIAAIHYDDEDMDSEYGRSEIPDSDGEGADLFRIDAGGKVVAPGFIDAHSHGDPLSAPEFDNFLHMGVTTITLGQDGRSPESGSVAEWMDRVDSVGTGVNILHFIGHGTVRNRVDAPPVTGLQPGILGHMQKIIGDAMRDGSFGLSTGLEYNPGYHSDIVELTAIARPVAQYGGLVMSHIRSEDDDLVEEAIRELIEQGRRSGARVHVSHLKIVYGKGEERARSACGAS